MININLLPEVMRKKEGTPLPQLLGYIVGFALLLLVGLMCFKYKVDIIPSLESRIRNLESQKMGLQAEVAEIKQMHQEIARLSDYVDTVKNLYRQRVVWAKILADLKNIVNYDPTMSEYNMENRYLWLTKLNGKESLIDITGFATASNQLQAMYMSEQLFQGLLTYKPDKLPEQGEEDRLNEQLRLAIAENEQQRRDNPDLPMQSERELAIREQLANVRNVKSGAIALQPFVSFLKPGSVKLVNTVWTAAPKPKVQDQAILALFSNEAWQFDIRMELRDMTAE